MPLVSVRDKEPDVSDELEEERVKARFMRARKGIATNANECVLD